MLFEGGRYFLESGLMAYFFEFSGGYSLLFLEENKNNIIILFCDFHVLIDAFEIHFAFRSSIFVYQLCVEDFLYFSMHFFVYLIQTLDYKIFKTVKLF